MAKQEAMKNDEIEITFSYWDGSGHRRSVRMKKGQPHIVSSTVQSLPCVSVHLALCEETGHSKCLVLYC